MKSKVKLTIGVVDVRVGFLARLYMMIHDSLACPTSIKFDGLTIELEGEVDPEVAQDQLKIAKQNVDALADFLAPYVKTVADKYVAAITSE